MSDDRRKNASMWFYENVYREEAIRPRQPQPQENIPSLLRAARSLEENQPRAWQTREQIFLKQGKLLAHYEDNYPCDCSPVRYYPTYQSFSNQELRAYFTWRTKLRKGDLRKTALSFAFLYIYELINQIGVADPMDGYEKLKVFAAEYGALDKSILPYLNTWLKDYVVYYDLPVELLKDTAQYRFDQSLSVLNNIENENPEAIVRAITVLSGKWLERSRLYKDHREDMDAVIVAVFRRASRHYSEKCIRNMVEQFFGSRINMGYRPFEAAVFFQNRKLENRTYTVNDLCEYRYEYGSWTLRCHPCPTHGNQAIGDILKTIDSHLRQQLDYGHPIQCAVFTKWLVKIIQEECAALLARKKAAEANKITIDQSHLERIRRDAAITRDKLIVDEETEPEETPAPVPEETPADTPLAPAEYKLLQCLLYGRDLGWVQREGHLLSVLADGINEKLYDNFLDSVLDDTPQLIEDYIDDLKEMVHP